MTQLPIFEHFEIEWIYEAIQTERKATNELYKDLPKQQQEKDDCIYELDGILKKIKTYKEDNASMNRAIRSLIYKQD